jgi:hypothetical protein
MEINWNLWSELEPAEELRKSQRLKEQLGIPAPRFANEHFIIYSDDIQLHPPEDHRNLLCRTCVSEAGILKVIFPTVCILLSLQGHGLRLPECTMQSSSCPGKLNIRLPGQHHQSHPHPAGFYCARVWRTRGAAPA